jgi:hypothetical protein
MMSQRVAAATKVRRKLSIKQKGSHGGEEGAMVNVGF